MNQQVKIESGATPVVGYNWDELLIKVITGVKLGQPSHSINLNHLKYSRLIPTTV